MKFSILSSLSLRVVVNTSLTLMLGACVSEMPGPGPAEMTRASNLVERGVDALRSGNLQAAEAAFAVSFEIAPSGAAADGLGCVAFLKGELVTAEGFFRRAAVVPGYESTALQHLALLFEFSGEVELARQYYRRAIARNPENWHARNNYAVWLHEQMSEHHRSRQEARHLLRTADVLAQHPIPARNLKRLFLK